MPAMAHKAASLMAAMAVGAGLTGLLAACSHDSASQSASGRFGLFYNDQGEMAALAYGAPNSDDVALMFECAKGTGRVEVTDVAGATAAPRLILASSGSTSDLAASEVSADGPDLLVARTDISAPALQAFRRSGKMKVAYGATSYTLAASNAERQGVERFFKACAARA